MNNAQYSETIVKALKQLLMNTMWFKVLLLFKNCQDVFFLCYKTVLNILLSDVPGTRNFEMSDKLPAFFSRWMAF